MRCEDGPPVAVPQPSSVSLERGSHRNRAASLSPALPMPQVEDAISRKVKEETVTKLKTRLEGSMLALNLKYQVRLRSRRNSVRRPLGVTRR